MTRLMSNWVQPMIAAIRAVPMPTTATIPAAIGAW